MRLVLMLVAALALTGCANGYRDFYKPFADAKKMPNMQLLGENETPAVFASNDLKRDVRIARSRLYVPIGVSSFNGAMGSQSDVINQARNVGAGLVLVNSQFAETRTITTPMFIPNNQTTTYSGTTNGNIYGSNGQSANYNSNTTGTATTYGTTVVPITRQQQRFNQEAVFLVKFTGKQGRVGIQIGDLTPELRSRYQRNTGAFVDVVNEDSPAFAANVLPDDIIIEFNGTSVLSPKHLIELIKAFDPNGGKCEIKVLRDGTEKSLSLQLNPV